MEWWLIKEMVTDKRLRRWEQGWKVSTILSSSVTLTCFHLNDNHSILSQLLCIICQMECKNFNRTNDAHRLRILKDTESLGKVKRRRPPHGVFCNVLQHHMFQFFSILDPHLVHFCLALLWYWLYFSGVPFEARESLQSWQPCACLEVHDLSGSDLALALGGWLKCMREQMLLEKVQSLCGTAAKWCSGLESMEHSSEWHGHCPWQTQCVLRCSVKCSNSHLFQQQFFTSSHPGLLSTAFSLLQHLRLQVGCERLQLAPALRHLLANCRQPLQAFT